MLDSVWQVEALEQSAADARAALALALETHAAEKLTWGDGAGGAKSPRGTPL